MIPNSTGNLLLETDTSTKSSLTYKIENGKITGKIDQKDALKQAVELVLSTNRFAFGIYSWDYGVELRNLSEISSKLLQVRAESRISEALLVDSRIKSIENFEATVIDKNLYISFQINSIFGELDYEGVI